MREGLYVTVGPKGIIKKHLSTNLGEMPLKETTIAEELIQFSEKTIPFNLEKDPQWIWDKIQQIETDPMIYMDFQEVFKTYLIMMTSHDPVHAALTRTKIEDEVPPPSRDVSLLKENTLRTISCMTAVNTAQILTNHVLNNLCLGKPIRAKSRHLYLYQSYVTTVFTLEDTLETQYLFRSEDTYYYFLLQHFIASKPNVARCEYCGRIFIPKTRKKTKYCDRIIRDGKTCKQIAPYLNRKERAAADRVISEFNRINDMLLHRLEREEYDKKASPIDLTREDYYKWLDTATDARNRYLAGDLSEEEAVCIIHVPTIQELHNSHSVDCISVDFGV